jgi:hypothetical protein
VLWLSALVFIGAEVRLDVGFDAAQARLANLADAGLLGRASNHAYRELAAELARNGPSGVSGLVKVKVTNLRVHEDFAVGAMRWETSGPGGALVPALDADVTLTVAGHDVTMLAVSGTYRPPLGSVGAGLDRTIMHRVAEATIRALTHHIAAAIVHPAACPGTRHAGPLRETNSWPEPEAAV